jgi:hypothetical protein
MAQGINRKASTLTLTTEHPSLVERRRIADGPVAVRPVRPMVQAVLEARMEARMEALIDARPEPRARNARGHCVDGRVCDHPDHGLVEAGEGVIHFIL